MDVSTAHYDTAKECVCATTSQGNGISGLKNVCVRVAKQTSVCQKAVVSYGLYLYNFSLYCMETDPFIWPLCKNNSILTSYWGDEAQQLALVLLPQTRFQHSACNLQYQIQHNQIETSFEILNLSSLILV